MADTCADERTLMVRYEAICRGFKSLKPPPPPPPLSSYKQGYHGNLIDEAEEDLQRLTWPELMFAGGVAGVAAWLVSGHHRVLDHDLWMLG